VRVVFLASQLVQTVLVRSCRGLSRGCARDLLARVRGRRSEELCLGHVSRWASRGGTSPHAAKAPEQRLFWVVWLRVVERGDTGVLVRERHAEEFGAGLAG
jgi:hypothetical protein